MRDENKEENQKEEKYDYEVIFLNGSRERGKVIKKENGEWIVRKNKTKNSYNKNKNNNNKKHNSNRKIN